MKFSHQITINQPRQRVIELITNRDYLPQWQTEIKSIELISGEKDQVGAKSRVVFDVNGFNLELIETIVSIQPPDSYTTTYESKGVQNRVVNRFIAVNSHETQWVLESEFTYSGLMSFAGIFLNGIVPGQTKESMKRFKKFAESR